MSGNLAPLPIWQFLDQNGHPISGGTISYFQSGTSTPAQVYADIGLTVPLPASIPLDSAGRPQSASGPTAIWLDPSHAYKQVLRDAAGQLIWTADPIVSPGTGAPGPPGPPGTITPEEDMTNEQVIGDNGSIALPDGFNQHIVYCANSNPLVLTGALAAPKAGTRLIIVSAGTAPVYLTTDSGGSHPGAFINPVSSGAVPLNGANGIVEYVFSVTDGNRWLLISHRQGLPITRDAGSWMYGTAIGSPGATWTVDPASVVAQQYELVGKRIRVWIEIGESAFVGSGGVLLINEAAWASYVPTLTTEFSGMCVVTQNGVHAICWAWITDNNGLRIENLTGEFQTSTIGLNIAAEFEVQ